MAAPLKKENSFRRGADGVVAHTKCLAELTTPPVPGGEHPRLVNVIGILFFTMILATALPCASSGQDREPLLGTWRLNFSESTFASGPPAYVRVTCKIEPWEDGLKVTYDMVGTRGGVTHWEWTGRLDGKDYPLEGVEEVVTNAYSRIADHTYNVVFKVDRRITTTTRIAISPDGKIMAVTTGSNAAIYNKR